MTTELQWAGMDLVPPFNAEAVKAELERLAGGVPGQHGPPSNTSIYGAYVIASRLCWAALDEIERLTAAQQAVREQLRRVFPEGVGERGNIDAEFVRILVLTHMLADRGRITPMGQSLDLPDLHPSQSVEQAEG